MLVATSRDPGAPPIPYIQSSGGMLAAGNHAPTEVASTAGGVSGAGSGGATAEATFGKRRQFSIR